MSGLTEKQLATLDRCWENAKGHGWEPQGGTDSPTVRNLVEAGFLRVVDGRCGFERLKDAMVTWTEAGRMVMISRNGEANR